MSATGSNKLITFGSWMSEGQELMEKLLGPVVLLTEIFLTFWEKVDQRNIAIYAINIFFISMVLYSRPLKHLFYLKAKRQKIPDPQARYHPLKLTYQNLIPHEKLQEYTEYANLCIFYFGKIRWFWRVTLWLYVLLFTKEILVKSIAIDLGNSPLFIKIFDIITTAVNTGSAYGLILCFYSLHSAELLSNRDITPEKMARWFWFFFAVLFLVHCSILSCDVSWIANNKITWLQGITHFVIDPDNVHDINMLAQFGSGLAVAASFAFLVSRFEITLMEIPIYFLVILYLYAALQTSLVWVLIDTGGKFGKLWEHLQNAVLSMCLLGKVGLYLTTLYIYSSGRLFYYFLRIRQELMPRQFIVWKDAAKGIGWNPVTIRRGKLFLEDKKELTERFSIYQKMLIKTEQQRQLSRRNERIKLWKYLPDDTSDQKLSDKKNSEYFNILNELDAVDTHTLRIAHRLAEQEGGTINISDLKEELMFKDDLVEIILNKLMTLGLVRFWPEGLAKAGPIVPLLSHDSFQLTSTGKEVIVGYLDT
ncbi:MAG: hypothetical protein JWO06_1922 [Bacteroidota bacterium]|nr:hypothetical protein [Bacteroidota bacterium]